MEESPVYRAVVEKTYKGETYCLYYGPYGTKSAAKGVATRELAEQEHSARFLKQDATFKSWAERLVGYWKKEEITS